jgi:hypothetical protein
MQWPMAKEAGRCIYHSAFVYRYGVSQYLTLPVWRKLPADAVGYIPGSSSQLSPIQHRG